MAIRSLKSGTFSRSGMVGNPVIMPGSYDSIATVTVGAGGASSVTFNSIPSTYQHLQIRYSARTTAAAPGSEGDLVLVYGSPHAANGYSHMLYGNGSTVGALNTGATQYSQYASFTTSSTQTSNSFGAGVVDVLDYTNTNKLKTWRTLGGWDANGSGFVSLASGIHNDTSVITSIGLGVNSGNSFAQYSTFALYGVN